MNRSGVPGSGSIEWGGQSRGADSDRPNVHHHNVSTATTPLPHTTQHRQRRGQPAGRPTDPPKNDTARSRRSRSISGGVVGSGTGADSQGAGVGKSSVCVPRGWIGVWRAVAAAAAAAAVSAGAGDGRAQVCVYVRVRVCVYVCDVVGQGSMPLIHHAQHQTPSLTSIQYCTYTSSK